MTIFNMGDTFIHSEYGTIYKITSVIPQKGKKSDRVYELTPYPETEIYHHNGKEFEIKRKPFVMPESSIRQMVVFGRWIKKKD